MSSASKFQSETETESSETVAEVGGTEADPEAAEAISGAHTPTSYRIPIQIPPPRRPKPPGVPDDGGDGGDGGEGTSGDEGFSIDTPFGSFGFEAGEEAGDESAFESDGVEAGWQESLLTEAAADEAAAEAVIDAEFASVTPEGQQEFFVKRYPPFSNPIVGARLGGCPCDAARPKSRTRQGARRRSRPLLGSLLGVEERSCRPDAGLQGSRVLEALLAGLRK